jgi:hypothetical protein
MSSACGGITESYGAPAARELPELRTKLGRWLAGAGPHFYLANFLIGRQWLPAAMSADEGAAAIAGQERQRVMAGELYWVSSAMTELARHAASSLPSWNLYKHDLPSGLGLMFFEAPLATYHNDEGRNVEIVAASWGPWSGLSGGWTKGGLWLTFYSHPAPVLPRAAFDASPRRDPGWLTLAQALPPILPDNEAGWPFGTLDTLPERVAGTTAQWALMMRSAWLLMRQPLAEHTRERASRPARRRLQRAGQPVPDVRVIHVRRPEHVHTDGDRGDGSREYNCQWWVNGHWRTYWCGPGRRRPEDRWISPYLAGPDGKPVRGTERVRVWDR